MGGQSIADSFVRQFAIYRIREVRMALQFPAYARAASRCFPLFVSATQLFEIEHLDHGTATMGIAYIY